MEKSGKMTGGLFTIITPAYNRAHIITLALDSVKAQTYRPIEIIIVDDGSLDNTKSVVETWAVENSEGDALSLRYFYQENAGPAAARNRGIQEIRGEYVQFLDSDDRLHHERLKRLAETFEKEQCDFIQTGFDGFDAETGETIEVHYGHLKHDLISETLMGISWPNTLRAGFKRDLIERIGSWNTQMTCFEDYEYVIRALIHARNPRVIRDILASARRGGGERVSDYLRTYEGRSFRILCEERLWEGFRNRKDISYAAKLAFASRLYALGFRSNASGWPDLGMKCGKLAESTGVELDALGKRRRLIWQLGRVGGLVYEYLYRIKEHIM